MAISDIKKRDGRIVKFEQTKITDAIHKALVAVHSKDGKAAKKLSDLVVKTLEKDFREKIPSVEDIQNIVINVLKKKGYEKVAQEYSDYRAKKAELRKLKEKFGIEKEPKLTVNALEVLRKRYLLKDEKGNITETPDQMFARVAKTIAEIDKLYGDDYRKTEEEFYEVMSKLEFLPNSPTLFNAGTGTNFGLSACYVLPIEDSLKSIFEAIKNMVIIEQSGGGVGFDFSRLRPKGDIVKSTKGIASGPCSFMRVFDIATNVVKQGGKRRGAMMGILRIDHPDILEFITIKSTENILTNFNLSVAITDEFIEAVKNNKEYKLINPRNKEIVKKLKAKKVWDLIIESAWKSGDPGLIFIDEINRKNSTPEFKISATNPCGEQPLLDYESCNLGSINLSRMIKNDEIDWEKLTKTVHTAIHFLDNVIDANYFSLKEIESTTKANRKIGLGIMGWAEFLIRLEIPYDSKQAFDLAELIMKFITEEARKKI